MSDQFQEFSGCFYLCSEAVTTLAAAGWAAKLLLRSGSLGCNGISESRRTPEQQAAAGADTTRGASLVPRQRPGWRMAAGNAPHRPPWGRRGAGGDFWVCRHKQRNPAVVVGWDLQPSPQFGLSINSSPDVAVVFLRMKVAGPAGGGQGSGLWREAIPPLSANLTCQQSHGLRELNLFEPHSLYYRSWCNRAFSQPWWATNRPRQSTNASRVLRVGWAPRVGFAWCLSWSDSHHSCV